MFNLNVSYFSFDSFSHMPFMPKMCWTLNNSRQWKEWILMLVMTLSIVSSTQVVCQFHGKRRWLKQNATRNSTSPSSPKMAPFHLISISMLLLLKRRKDVFHSRGRLGSEISKVPILRVTLTSHPPPINWAWMWTPRLLLINQQISQIRNWNLQPILQLKWAN